MPIITSINRTGTFLDCSNLQTVNIPNVTVIGKNTFKNCTSLSIDAATLSNLVNIEEYAFYNCTGLTGILNCPNLTGSVNYPGSSGWAVFSGCTGL